jgi:hypothetical protein
MTTDNMLSVDKFYSFETLKEIIPYDGDLFGNLCKALRFLSHNDTCNREDWSDIREIEDVEWFDDEPPDDQNNCICGHHIKKMYWAVNKYNQNIVCVGSSCITKFGDVAIARLKELKEKRKNIRKCFKCNKTVSAPIVKKYSHEKNIYHKKCYKVEIKIETLPPPYEPVQPVQPAITGDTIISFGKFKGKTINDLLKDISYCKWIINLQDASGAIEKIQEYLKTIII